MTNQSGIALTRNLALFICLRTIGVLISAGSLSGYVGGCRECRVLAPEWGPRPLSRFVIGSFLGGLLFLGSVASAATLYVNASNSTPAAPYSDWATAAISIQDAVDAAVAGDEVIVTDGVYATGGRAMSGLMTNRVAVDRPITLRSVNGPAVTQIVGNQVPGTTNGPAAVRCVWLNTGAVLAGFTLTNGATQIPDDDVVESYNHSGGGVWCEGPSVVVSNCVLTGNSAYHGGGAYWGTLKNCLLTHNSAREGGGARASVLSNCVLTGNSAYYGGGAYLGMLDNCMLTNNSASNRGGGVSHATLNNCTLALNLAGHEGGAAYNTAMTNCLLTGNSASYGGGAYQSSLNNCTVTGNSAAGAGGAYQGTLNNCIVYYNNARYGSANYLESILNYCCTTPLPAGTGNLSAEPELASASHLSFDSPCRRRGSAAYASGMDVDGEPWANPPSIGCDEYWSGSVTGALSVALVPAYTNISVGFGVDFQAVIGGRVNASRWDFGDGSSVVSNRPWATHAWTAVGDYVVELRAYNESYPAGVAATVRIRVVAPPTHYVALNSSDPRPPYSSWSTAATNIQDAVDAATVPGALVWVTDGVYQYGARELYGMSNRVAVTKPVIVRSVNGPAVTQILGYRVPETTNGPGAVRCAYLASRAVLAGFTLTNGATQTPGVGGTYNYTNHCGGGVWCEGLSAVISNCVFASNSACYGGGAYSGTLSNCTFMGNTAENSGGGTSGGTLDKCTLTANSAKYGGGAYRGTLNNCTVIGNTASYSGGGASYSTLNNCLLTRNSAVNYYGGGTYNGTLNNCTVTGNSDAQFGGGCSASVLNNCILYYNRSPYGSGNWDIGTLNHCCTTPLPHGKGNLTNAPLFMNTNGWSDLRLQSSSPCINAGGNGYAPLPADLDGNPRIVSGTVDMGAYEYQGEGSRISYAWLQRYSLPTDGSADFGHADADGMNNWQEWQADTDPTNSWSALRLSSISAGPPAEVQFSNSSPNRLYSLLYATNLDTAPWASVPGQTDVPGVGGSQVLRDTNAVPPRFFRVRVRLP